MSKAYSFIPVINKVNGQVNISLKKKDLPREIVDRIRKEPLALKKIIADKKHFNFVFKADDLNG